MKSQKERVIDAIGDQKVIPVIKISDPEDTVPFVTALARGGLKAVEITLRTPAALDAVRIAAEIEGVVTGAGTILNARQFEQAERAGARFIVSPGATLELLDAAKATSTPLLPGAITPSEMMGMMEEGYGMLKFFPAEQAGGAPFLKSISSPLAGLSFCPTGGITATTAQDYLKLPNVVCIGGSWMAPDALVAARDWKAIEELAREAAAL